MNYPDDFQYDVRIRRRSLHKGMITDGDVEKRLAALPDLDDECDRIDIGKPGAVPASAPPPPPPAAPAPIASIGGYSPSLGSASYG